MASGVKKKFQRRTTSEMVFSKAVAVLLLAGSCLVGAGVDTTFRGSDVPDPPFLVELTDCDGSLYPMAEVEATAKKVGGLADILCSTKAGVGIVAEWGYSYFNLKVGEVDGGGLVQNYTADFYKTPPSSKDEAIARMKRYYDFRTDFVLDKVKPLREWRTHTGHYYFQHIGCQWSRARGLPNLVVATEIGENINSINAHLAFTRGAARQFDARWLVDFSAWFIGAINDYSGTHHWGDKSCATCGHSVSLFRRAYYATYMAGADILNEEGAGIYFFTNRKPDGTIGLSEIGEMASRLYQQSRGTSRPQPVVPAAILLDAKHGMGLGYWYSNMSYDTFPLTPAEHGATLLFESIWPGSFQVTPLPSLPEANYMAHTPVGEAVDVFITGAPLAGLEEYSVIHLAGNMDSLSSEEISWLSDWLKAKEGRTLVVGADHLPFIPQDMLGFIPEEQAIFSAHCLADNCVEGSRDVKVATVGPNPTATVYKGMVFTSTDGQSSTPGAVSNSVGGSRVISNLVPDHDSDGAFQLTSRIMETEVLARLPFRIQPSEKSQATLQHLHAVRDSTPMLLLINNDGVTKHPDSPPVVDSTKVALAVVTSQGSPIIAASNVETDQPLEVTADGEVQVSIGPGEHLWLSFQLK